MKRKNENYQDEPSKRLDQKNAPDVVLRVAAQEQDLQTIRRMLFWYPHLVYQFSNENPGIANHMQGIVQDCVRKTNGM